MIACARSALALGLTSTKADYFALLVLTHPERRFTTVVLFYVRTATALR